MKLKPDKIILLALFCLVVAPIAAQNDGDHTLTNGNGESFLAPDAQIGGGTVPPFNFTVGNSATTTSTLSVRADQLLVNDPLTPLGAGGAAVFSSFRTDGGNSVWQTWRMMRATNEIGLLYGRGDHRAFHIQAPSVGDVTQDEYSGVFI